MANFTSQFVLTGGESPSGTLVTTTTQQIAASQTTGVASAAGPWDVWALTAGAQISRNGLVDGNTGGVTKLYYANHTLYQFNGTSWWYYNTARSTSTTFSWTSVLDPTATVTSNIWNAAQKSGGMTISSDGRTATLTVTATTDEIVFAKEITTSGGQFAALIYWEVVINSLTANGQVGIGTNTAGVGDGTYLGINTLSLGWLGTGQITYNNAATATWASYASGSRLCLALDLVNGKLWGRLAGGNWNNDVLANQNPATNTGGLVIPTTIFATGSTSVFVEAAASLANNNETVIASFEPANWLFAPPVGYQPWSATIPSTATVTATVQVPVGVHTGLGLSFVPSGGSLWSSEIAHYNGFNTAMNRKATVLATILGANTPTDYQPASSPNTWGNGDVGTWTGQGFPSDGSVAPMLHWNFSNGSTSNAFSVYSPANISTATTFGGQTVAHWITAQLDAWRVNANIKKMYIRINWEWNIGGPDGSEFDVGGTGGIAGWLNAWRGFCNVAHDWGNANAVEVHTVWCPSVFNQTTPKSYGQPCIAFFPQPDANAHAGSDGVTKRYVDVLGLDFYGQVTSDFRPTGYNDYVNNQVWCMPAMHVICQQFNIPFALSECNDQFSPSVTTGYQNWIPNDLVPYLNSLKNLSPAVKIEYITLFDLNVGGTTEFSFPNEASGNLSLFGQAFGGLGSSSFGSCPKVTTLA